MYVCFGSTYEYIHINNNKDNNNNNNNNNNTRTYAVYTISYTCCEGLLRKKKKKMKENNKNNACMYTGIVKALTCLFLSMEDIMLSKF